MKIKVSGDRSRWLVFIPMMIGIAILIVGELPLPGHDGWIVVKGFTARVGGIGFIALGFSFFGLYHHAKSDSAWQWIIDRFLFAHLGKIIFAGCFLYVVMEVAKEI